MQNSEFYCLLATQVRVLCTSTTLSVFWNLPLPQSPSPDHAVSHDDGEFLSKISAVHCSGNFLFARMEDDEKTKKKLAYFFLFSFHSPFPNLFCYRHAVPFTSGWRILVILIASIHGQRHVSFRPPSICQRTIVLFTKHGSNFAKQRAGAALSNTTHSWKIYTAICHPFRARCAF